MRLTAQIKPFALTQNCIEGFKNGSFIYHSVFRSVSKGGVSLLPGQTSSNNIYLSAVPLTNFGGNVKDILTTIGSDIVPYALAKVGDNVENKIARNILYTAAKAAPYATKLISSNLNKNVNSYTPVQPRFYQPVQAISYKPKSSIDYKPRSAIEYHPTNAIEYKGSGNNRTKQLKKNTRAKKAYKNYISQIEKPTEKRKQNTLHKGGSFRYD